MISGIYLDVSESLPSEFPEEEIIETSLKILISYFEKKLDKKYEVSLSIVNDEEIRLLNKEYRKKDSKTDVLSFPMLAEDEFPDTGESTMLGDIVISYETCLSQSIEIGHSLKDEFFRLLVHGFLHLMGYDHEISPEEEKKMKEKEDEMLEILEKEGL
ncbi:MAG: rRNA maturation RNase YbeY [Spirochaetia bacterium]|nr:rRNA maturation RNase YbeY [Spirochaetia bacterium]